MADAQYLLDTDILSDLIKHPGGKVARKIASLESEDQCCTSIIVASEMRYGVLKKSSALLNARVDQLLDTISILPFDAPADQKYAEQECIWKNQALSSAAMTCSLPLMPYLQS